MLEPAELEYQSVHFNCTDPNKNVSLQGVRINSVITGFIEKTTVEQVFTNDENTALEICYTFPLPPDASVCGFEVFTDNKVLTGVIEMAEKAVEIYDEAINEGNGSFRIDQHRPDIFTVHVGNIEPNQTAMLRVEYVRSLSSVDGTLQLVYPTTVAPRYVSHTGSINPSESIIDGEMINSPLVNDMLYGLSLNVTVVGSSPIESIVSHTHDIISNPNTSTQSKPQDQTISLRRGLTEMNRDLLIDITLASSEEPVCFVEKGPGNTSWLALNFVPDIDAFPMAAPSTSNIVFVVDCSGSMTGAPIEQAKRALSLCLKTLSEGDQFMLIKFGSDFEMFDKKLSTYNAKTLKKALAWVKELDANLGGTELFSPIESVYAATGKESAVDIVLLTDGQVSNESAIISAANKYKSSHRFFTFGIGAAASRHLCTGLANATKGAAEFIQNKDRIEPQVLRVFSRIASPILNDVSISSYPQQARIIWAEPDLPPMFDGDAICLLAEITGPVPTQWTIQASHASGPVELPVNVVPVKNKSKQDRNSAEFNSTGIAQLWATKRINFLESELAVSANSANSANSISTVSSANTPATKSANPSRLRRQISKLSKEHNVLSMETSFVSVEHRSLSERNNGLPAFRQVPLMPPLDAQLFDGWPSASVSDSIGGSAYALFSRQHSSNDAYSKPFSYSVNESENSMDMLDIPAFLRRTEGSSDLYDLLDCQNADGSFTLSDGYVKDAIEYYSKKYEALEEDLTSSEFSFYRDTLYAIHLLGSKYKEFKSQWIKSSAKANKFLNQLVEA